MSSRNCTLCGEPISDKRLKAVPGATECVPCLNVAGDVPRIKRFDDYSAADCNVDSSYFYHNPYLSEQIRRVGALQVDNASIEVAVGDDSHLTRETPPEVIRREATKQQDTEEAELFAEVA